MADNYEIDLEIEGGEQPDLVMNVQGGEQPELNLQTEGGATDGASARNAEAWANGTRNGVPVTEGDPAYHNNSKYYRDSAAAIVAGDIIDDDAGIGDYDLTWSADKLAGEFEGKATAIGVTDTESAAVKTISDGADGMPMGLSVGIEPVQDLHGYDNPWPAGGGKNLYNPDEAVQNKWLNSDNGEVVDSSGYWVTGFIPVVPGGTYTKTDMGSSRSCGYDASKQFVSSIPWTGSAKQMPEGVYFVRCTGKTETIAYNGQVQIESGSSATDYAPYSNVCPISGRDSANVENAGAINFIPKVTETLTKNTFTITPLANGQINLSHSASSWDTIELGQVVFKKGTVRLTMFNMATGNTQLVIKKHGQSETFYALRWATNGNIEITEAGLYDIFIAITGTRDEDVMYGLFYDTTISSSTWVAPGKESIYSIAFTSEAGTVYGGSLTVNADGTGTLVVDRAYDQMTASALSGATITRVVKGEMVGFSVRNWHYQDVPGISANTPYYPCNVGKVNYNDRTISSSQYRANVFVSNDTTAFPTVQDFLDMVEDLEDGGSGLFCVYPLKNPVTYTLSNLEVIETLKGMNNLWADTGGIKAVDYPADTKLYVDGKISEGMKLIALLLTANHEDGMKASKAYASGDLLTVGNTLYKATTSIANGATLTAGTNVTETTIAQELAALA